MVIKNNLDLRCHADSAEQKQAIRQRLQNIGNIPQSVLTNERNRDVRTALLDIQTKPNYVYVEGAQTPRSLLYTAHLKEKYSGNHNYLNFDLEIYLNVSRFIAYHGSNMEFLLERPLDWLVTGCRRNEFHLRRATYDNSDNYLSREQYNASHRFLEPMACFMHAVFGHFFREVARHANVDIRSRSTAGRNSTYSEPEEVNEGLTFPYYTDVSAAHVFDGNMTVNMDDLVVNPLEVYVDFACDNALHVMQHEVKPIFQRMANDISQTRYQAFEHANPLIDWEEREKNCITLRFPLHLESLNMKAYAKQSDRIRFEITLNSSIREIQGQANPELTHTGRFLNHQEDFCRYHWPESVYALRGIIPLISEAMTDLMERFSLVMENYRSLRAEITGNPAGTVNELLTLHRVIHAQRNFSQELRVQIIEVLLATGSYEFEASDVNQGGRYRSAVLAIQRAGVWRTVPYADRRSRHSYSLTEPYQRMRERLNQL